MPVDQTGETILFVLEDGTVEAHIQIEYDPETEAQRFAWVIPVMSVPEFSVGSQPLFDALLTSSVPRYGTQTWFEPCGGSVDPCGEGDDDDGSIKLDAGGAGGGEPPPEVVEHTLVGAFEIFVIEGGTPQSVSDWLDANGFAPDPAATPILGEYLDEGFSFVAMKLAVDAGADEVHPVVLRMAGTEPCVPIRLTRIAASDDLSLRTLFLSESRVVPESYQHVVLNDLILDWTANAPNYTEAVTLAVDEAGGHAFVTEYAGPSDIVDPTGLVSASWDPEVFRQATWLEAAFILRSQSWLTCDPGFDPPCQFFHPLLESILTESFTLPDGVTLQDLLVCPDCQIGVFDDATWDPEALADRLQERIVAPGLHGEELLTRWPYLTRMYTTLSPHEMTVDPTFFEHDNLIGQTGLVRQASVATFCDGERSAQLPDGRLIALLGSGWPSFEDMPFAERVERFNPVGAPMVELDNRPQIDALLEEWNALHGPPRPSFGPACGDDTDGWDPDAPSLDTDGPTAGASDEIIERSTACACRTERAEPLAPVAMLLVVLGLRRRRGSR